MSIEEDTIRAAQKYDAATRQRPGNWQAVPAEQVARLLAGADLYRSQLGITVAHAEEVPR